MKIKRFVDTSMRHVLRQVREDQGPDAVILSNRRVENGIEVIAAIDYDEALIQQALGTPPAAADSERQGTEPEAVAKKTIKKQRSKKPFPLSGFAGKAREPVEVVSADIRPAGQTDIQQTPAQPVEELAPRSQSTDEPVAVAAVDNENSTLKSLQSEVSIMRDMMETQLSSLVWKNTASSSPMRAQILRNLTKIGIGPDIANIIVDRLPPISDPRMLWRMPLNTLAKLIPVADDPLLREGGVAALVGPTGVGKTTTIAKIAARYAMQFGANQIALISADAHRIGSYEQLATFGNILGVKVHGVEDVTALEQLLDQLKDKKLVLIDTEGCSQRNSDLTARLAAYGRNKDRVKFYLTLAATCQEAGLDESVRVFNRIPLSGAVVTKIDEAAQLGCVLSTLIRHDLKAAFLSDGQRIPDDLHLAAKKRFWLINQAVESLRSSNVKIDEQIMTEKFGRIGVAHV